MPDGKELLRLVSGWRGTADFLRQQSLREGLWHGKKNWLAVGAVVWSIRGIRKAFEKNETVVLREVLQPGVSYVITEAITRPTRRQRRHLPKSS